MSRFYLLLWVQWSIRLTVTSILSAAFIAALITLYIYVEQGMRALDHEVYRALYAIWQFWFTLSWSFTLLLSLFLGLKHIFNVCTSGYKLTLLSCPDKDKISSVIETIGYGDLVKVWRKWLMLLIWLVGAQMILAVAVTTIVGSYSSIFEWFSIYILYGFILIAGYFSFMILSVRCKKVKVAKC